jgi:hypothetical protein
MALGLGSRAIDDVRRRPGPVEKEKMHYGPQGKLYTARLFKAGQHLNKTTIRLNTSRWLYVVFLYT